MVRLLSNEGMSTRTIGAIVGADQKTVVNDRRNAREEFSSPEPERVDLAGVNEVNTSREMDAATGSGVHLCTPVCTRSL